MARKLSMLAPDWWDFTTLPDDLLNDAAKLTPEDILQLSRPGFKIMFYNTIEEFYLAEALEYITAWKQSTSDNPVGICGPIGPTEQLPLVARMVNELQINLQNSHFWGMDEWYVKGKELDARHPISFEKADRDMCFNLIDKNLMMPDANMHFPKAELTTYINSWESGVRCAVMQGGQGDTKHWAFNDPVKREGRYKDEPPSPEEFRKLTARVVDLHPVTIMQNARTSAGGVVTGIPSQALTVGPVETWKAEKVSIWHAGTHDNPFGQRLTAMMISKRIADSSVPMSLLADHPNVQFNYYTGGIGVCETEMH
ncbi:MAG TPA: glucosamine-6-phosphate isomerase [Bacteroidales bacterium]|nr:MAG: glucosamine-6-phosphate isomerase [Bacteroidetes bacterium GWC2_40_22]HAM09695.1 glucosamine-6-phosphate isomerase [Bacteroidales bacterium]HBH84819.1 glucosamine-6-phosphate isomerase [Bacteroidales bacterium]HBQ82207.1 glucosamine-6-phosphate isomerase [Bacteroidales bacterium]